MAGEAGAVAQRMQAVGDALATEVERAAEALRAMDTPTDPGGVDKKMKAARSVGLAARTVMALAADVERLRAGTEDAEGDGEDDEEELDDAGLEALRCEVDRLYARFDQEPHDATGDDLGDARAPAEAGRRGLGGPGPRPSAAAA